MIQFLLYNSKEKPSGPGLLLPSQDQIASFTSSYSKGFSKADASSKDKVFRLIPLSSGFKRQSSLKNISKCLNVCSLISSTPSSLPSEDSMEQMAFLLLLSFKEL